jgi:hypothetical protein
MVLTMAKFRISGRVECDPVSLNMFFPTLQMNLLPSSPTRVFETSGTIYRTHRRSISSDKTGIRKLQKKKKCAMWMSLLPQIVYMFRQQFL